jgi:hypothetical protein
MSTVRRRPQKMIPTALKFKLPWGSRIQLQRHEIGLVMVLAAVAGYSWFAAPEILATALATGTIAVAFGVLNQSAITLTGVGIPVKAWHLGSLVVAISMIAAVGHVDPASAQIFNSLEQAVNDAVSGTNGTTVDQGTIAVIFNIFRILVVLAFLIGAVIIIAQALRGGDWQPVLNLVAIGVAFVIGIEVVSALIIGGGGGGA